MLQIDPGLLRPVQGEGLSRSSNITVAQAGGWNNYMLNHLCNLVHPGDEYDCEVR